MRSIFRVACALSVAALHASFASPGFAQEPETQVFVDPKIPASWYEPLKTASEVGIEKFSESPALAGMVAEGDLPPVAERLPADPPVVVPYDSVGTYGGTALVWAQERDYRGDTMTFNWPESGGDFPAGIPTPDGQDVIPYALEGWSYNHDATEMTINFREGLKWSDGVEVTADDYMFWWEHVATKRELSPVAPADLTPVGLLDVEKLGEYSVKLTWAGPYPRAHEEFYIRLAPARPFNPAHFMQQFHPDFIGEERANEIAQEAGFETWGQFYLAVASRDRGGMADRPDQPQYQPPTVRPYLYVERNAQGMLWRRNPYWPFVDTAGNQLPYIDEVRVNLAGSPDIAVAKMVTGEADISSRFTETVDIPSYKANEAKGSYTTHLYHRVYGSDVSLQLNLSHPDPDMRAVFWDPRFRQALSHAIDRREINDKVYYGEANVMQATIPPTSQYFKPEYAEAFVEYDPDKARALLDEMGMVDTDGDGWREMPNGGPFNPELVHAPIGIDPAPVVELFKPMFDDIGLNIRIKAISRELHDTMWPANEGDIHALLMDQLTDTSFGVADKDFSPAGVGEGKDTPWPAYRTWYITSGERGLEPPDILKETIAWRDILATAPSADERRAAADSLLRTQAENLWYIGTVSMAPHPVMVSNRLKNVPEKGLWDWRMTYMGQMRPQQFYIAE